MVYMEPSAMGLDPMTVSWIHVLPEKFPQDYKDKLKHWIETLVDPMIYFVRKKLKEVTVGVGKNVGIVTWRVHSVAPRNGNLCERKIFWKMIAIL